MAHCVGEICKQVRPCFRQVPGPTIRSNSSFRWTVNSAPRASGIRLQCFASGRHIIWPANSPKWTCPRSAVTLWVETGVFGSLTMAKTTKLSRRPSTRVKDGAQNDPYDGDNNSDLFRAKRVAARHLAGFQACGEPASALLGCAMGEGIWYNITLALPLQSIIANG